MEQRKHITQMSPKEITSVLSAVRSNRDYPVTNYSDKRVSSRNLPDGFMPALLSYGKLVEVHQVNNDTRVLIRGKVRGTWVCAVVSLTNKILITAYLNKLNDHHQTLDISQYNWDGEIVL